MKLLARIRALLVLLACARPVSILVRIRALLFLLLAYLAVCVLLSHLSLAVNRSPSLPRGLYRLVRRPAHPAELVAVCLPPRLAALALARHYLPPGPCPGGVHPLGKVLLATTGHEVAVTPAGLVLDGRAVPRSRPLLRDGWGLPLAPYPPGVYRVPPGSVWVFSPYHPLAWDSRYFGPLPAESIAGVLVPLWIETLADPPSGYRLRSFDAQTF
jgi:conjugative transfer signal peptidase TraF